MDLEKTIQGCERLLNDEFSSSPEGLLYMIGDLDDVEPARELRKGEGESGESGESGAEAAPTEQSSGEEVGEK